LDYDKNGVWDIEDEAVEKANIYREHVKEKPRKGYFDLDEAPGVQKTPPREKDTTFEDLMKKLPKLPGPKTWYPGTGGPKY